MDITYVLLATAACAFVTFIERALPFVAGEWLESHGWVRTMGNFLPLAIMVILVVDGGVSGAASHPGLPVPEVLALSLTVVLQWFFKNALISIFSGTALYVAIMNGWIPFAFF